MADTQNTQQEYQMNTKLGAIAMFLSATGMGLVPLFGRMSTRVDMFDATKGLNAGDSVGAFMATGRMTIGMLVFILLVFAMHKVEVFKKLKVSFSILAAGACIGLSLACYVTSTLLTYVANAVLFIYIGPVICVILATIFRKEPFGPVQFACLAAVFIGMLFGNGLIGFNETGFGVDLSLEPSTPEFPQKGIGDLFGILSGFFYGGSMFFNGYRKDADSIARGVWNFLAAAVAAGLTCALLNFLGVSGIAGENWALNLHLTSFNWIATIGFWFICGAFALGFLLVAGRNLPAAEYATIAYWEIPVALFVGTVVFSEPITINTFIALILIVGGGALPTMKTLFAKKEAA